VPHCIPEYTDNIREEARLVQLLEKAHVVLISHGHVFLIGGIRSSAIELHDYRIADGTKDDAFVHATVKIDKGRSKAVKKQVCDEFFDGGSKMERILSKGSHFAVNTF
jgi:5-carboxymethyl-2-hydroxymuconate isomerase